MGTKTIIFAQGLQNSISDSTLRTIFAAKKLADEIHLIIVGESLTQALIENAKKIDGVKKVFIAKSPHFKNLLAEDVCDLIAKNFEKYDYIVADNSSFSKNFMPRVAGMLNIEMISEISLVIDPNTFERPIYAGNAIETIQSSAKQKIITIRASSFDKALVNEGQTCEIQEITFEKKFQNTKFVALSKPQTDVIDLTSAKIVVSGGRGVKSKENFQIIENFAKKLKAAVGATRAAVDAGFAPNHYQVGQTGKIVAPEIYFAIGLSGAIQHLAGMKESKIIVAINIDPNAPIFEVATYGLVEDLFKAIPEIESKL